MGTLGPAPWDANGWTLGGSMAFVTRHPAATTRSAPTLLVGRPGPVESLASAIPKGFPLRDQVDGVVSGKQAWISPCPSLSLSLLTRVYVYAESG